MARTKGSKDKKPRKGTPRTGHYKDKYDIAIYDELENFEDIVPNGYELAKWLGVPSPEKWLRRGMLSNCFRWNGIKEKRVKDAHGKWHTLTFIEIEKENL